MRADFYSNLLPRIQPTSPMSTNYTMAIPGKYAANRENIASRLIELDSRQPGIVRIRANPKIVPAAVMMLKDMGFKKKFLQSPEQFVVDCALSYYEPMHAFMPYTLLSGPMVNYLYHCWYGDGQYAGTQGQRQLSDFTSGAHDKTLLIIFIQPVFDQLSAFLDAIE